MDTYNKVDTALNVLGATIGLSMIQDIVGIVIMVLTGINILIKLYMTIRQHIKDKNIDAISKDIENTTKELQDLVNKEDD